MASAPWKPWRVTVDGENVALSISNHSAIHSQRTPLVDHRGCTGNPPSRVRRSTRLENDGSIEPSFASGRSRDHVRKLHGVDVGACHGSNGSILDTAIEPNWALVAGAASSKT